MEIQILMELIGHGAYGSVQKGLHIRKGNFVAVKRISITKSTSEEHLKSLTVNLKNHHAKHSNHHH
jgi:serine/threonine protein kinase